MSRHFLLIATAGFGLLLASCSSSTETATSPEETASAEPEATEPAATESEVPEEAAEVAEPAPAEAAPAEAAPAAAGGSAPVAVNTDTKKAIYAVGLDIYRSLEQLDLSAEEIEVVKRALSDAKAGKPVVDFEEWRPKVSDLAQARAGRVADREKKKAEAYLATAAAKAGAQKSASGMVFLQTKAGNGASPKAADTVTVHYRGTLIDGTEFDSSYSRNQPASFPLNQVIPCWTEGVQKMKVGGKATLTCPSDIAYGDSGRPPRIPGGATLVFDIELLEIGGNNAK